jgi:hypothetical protein
MRPPVWQMSVLSHRRRARRHWGGWAFVIAVLAASVMAAVVIALGIINSPNQFLAGAARASCSSSGCAVVSLSRTFPPTTVFYGASCSGVYGSWFLNVVEGGGSAELRPSYALRWSFGPGSKLAKPSGSITVPATASAQITMTLNEGKLSLTGTRKPSARITATGTLVVELSGTPTSPELKFTETGLAKAESSLGLVSPFNVGGSPLTVPVKTVKTMSGC